MLFVSLILPHNSLWSLVSESEPHPILLSAIAIGQNIAKHREQKFEEVAVFDRVNKGIRKDGDIGFSALRSGGIWGEHEVIFAGSTEVVTIGSRALSREVFANGALFAARWLSSITEPGLYLMQDIFKI